jgi:hypothetical protein
MQNTDNTITLEDRKLMQEFVDFIVLCDTLDRLNERVIVE